MRKDKFSFENSTFGLHDPPSRDIRIKKRVDFVSGRGNDLRPDLIWLAGP